MEQVEWKHLALRLLGIGGPSLFLLVPFPRIASIQLFSGVDASLYLSLLAGFFCSFFIATDLLFYRSQSDAARTGAPIFVTAFLSSFILIFTASQIMQSPHLTPLAFFGYRLVTLSLWGTLCGSCIGLGRKSKVLTIRLGQVAFAVTSLISLVILLLFENLYLTEMWALSIPLYLSLAIFEVVTKKAWLIEESSGKREMLWIIYGDETTLGNDRQRDIPISPHIEVNTLIMKGQECYYLENRLDSPVIYLNNHPVSSAMNLKNGDHLRIGNHDFTFREKRQHRSASLEEGAQAERCH